MPEKDPKSEGGRARGAPPAPARPEEAWTEEEKARGAAPGADAGAAGEPEPKGRPTSERAATEGAAAAELRDASPAPARPGGAVPPRG